MKKLHRLFETTRMKIGFGAIGKGYAADKAKALLIDAGVVGGIINASGDLNTWGKTGWWQGLDGRHYQSFE